MIDLYFQSSPPLTLVMDFFIYPQLSLSFNVRPAQPLLRFKCCVKQIRALMFSCRLQLLFCSGRRNRTGSRSCALLVVLSWAPSSGHSPGEGEPWDVPAASSSTSPHCWPSAGKRRSPVLCATIHFLYGISIFSRFLYGRLEPRILLDEEK